MTLAPALTQSSPARPVTRGSRRVAGLLAIAFAVSSVGLLAAPRPADAWSSGSFSSTSERQLVSLTNQSRAAAGLRALKVDSTLTSIARWRSKDMITRDYFSHNIPPGGYNVFHVLDQKRYCYAIAGENIGWNNYPDDVATGVVHNSFMQSPGHRSNILDKRWDVIGVGAYKGPTGKKMWTVIFADKCGSTKSSGSSGGGGSKADPQAEAEGAGEAEGDAAPDPEADARADAGPDDAADPDRPDRTGLRPGRPAPGRRLDRAAGRRLATGRRRGQRQLVASASSTPSRPGCIETIVGGVDRLLPRRLIGQTSRPIADPPAPTFPRLASRPAEEFRGNGTRIHGSTDALHPHRRAGRGDDDDRRDPRGPRPHEALPPRGDDRRRAARRLADRRRGRVRRAHGPVGLRQVDAPPAARRPRPADVRRGHARGRDDQPPVGRRGHDAPPRPDRLRLPVLQPDPAPRRHRERRAAVHDRRPRRGRASSRSGSATSSPSSTSPARSTTGPTSCRPASSSGSRSPGPS